jgi:GMP synthase (glutamine-hydrolysing)
MQKSYLVLDPAMKCPALASFNQLVKSWSNPIQYISANLFPSNFSSLKGQDFAGIIIFGSHSNVEERASWHKTLSDFALDKCEKGTPVLGICFGHQLMADALGGEVIKNKTGLTHHGIRNLVIKDNLLNFKKDEQYPVFVSHSYEITNLPNEFITLASTEVCENEIVTHKKIPYLGIQGHPEGSLEFVAQEISVPLNETEINHAQWGGSRFLQNFKVLCETTWKK